jgi:hypothetical protein
VQKLYREAMEIIKGNEELLEESLDEKSLIRNTGKEYWIKNEDLERSLAIPEVSKHLLNPNSAIFTPSMIVII